MSSWRLAHKNQIAKAMFSLRLGTDSMGKVFEVDEDLEHPFAVDKFSMEPQGQSARSEALKCGRGVASGARESHSDTSDSLCFTMSDFSEPEDHYQAVGTQTGPSDMGVDQCIVTTKVWNVDPSLNLVHVFL